MKKCLPLLILPLLLAGCSAATEAAPSTSAAPTLGHAASVHDLQVAYVSASGTCPGELEDVNQVEVAAASGVCPETGTVLSTYVTHDDAANAVRELNRLQSRIGGTLILGDNWVVNPSGADKARAAEVAKAMGGEVISREATPVTSLDDAMTLEQAAEAYSHVEGALCASPTPEQDGSVLRCDDDTGIFDLDGIPAETPTLRQAAADELQSRLGDRGTVLIGRRHMLLLPTDMDAEAVAAQLDAATASTN